MSTEPGSVLGIWDLFIPEQNILKQKYASNSSFLEHFVVFNIKETIALMNIRELTNEQKCVKC